MRQYERQRESSSRASTAASTPIPWVDNSSEIRDLRAKIEELSKLNYNKDIAMQKQREQMELMKVKNILDSNIRAVSLAICSFSGRQSYINDGQSYVSKVFKTL